MLYDGLADENIVTKDLLVGRVLANGSESKKLRLECILPSLNVE